MGECKECFEVGGIGLSEWRNYGNGGYGKYIAEILQFVRYFDRILGVVIVKNTMLIEYIEHTLKLQQWV